MTKGYLTDDCEWYVIQMGTTQPTDGGTLATRVGDASNVLLVAPSLDSTHVDDACMEFLTVADPGEEDVLSISFNQSVDDAIDAWRSHAGTLPARLAVVSVGEETRSASAQGTTLSGAQGTVTVDTVANPSDLTGIGIAVSGHLSAWAEDDRQAVVCLDSLSILLQYVDLKRAFRFLHVLTNRVEAVGATGHYHIDPTVHDESTVGTLMQLFDAVVRFEDGEWTVRTR